MMNRMMNVMVGLVVTMVVMGVTLGVWAVKTESGQNAASRLTAISVELLMSMIHVVVDACRLIAA